MGPGVTTDNNGEQPRISMLNANVNTVTEMEVLPKIGVDFPYSLKHQTSG